MNPPNRKKYNKYPCNSLQQHTSTFYYLVLFIYMYLLIQNYSVKLLSADEGQKLWNKFVQYHKFIHLSRYRPLSSSHSLHLSLSTSLSTSLSCSLSIYSSLSNSISNSLSNSLSLSLILSPALSLALSLAYFLSIALSVTSLEYVRLSATLSLPFCIFLHIAIFFNLMLSSKKYKNLDFGWQ